jgi:excisionase family DNA binding protein
MQKGCIMERPLKLVLTVAECAAALSVSQRHVWRLISRNELPHIKLGGRTVVPVAALEAFLRERAASVSSASENGR